MEKNVQVKKRGKRFKKKGQKQHIRAWETGSAKKVTNEALNTQEHRAHVSSTRGRIDTRVSWK